MIWEVCSRTGIVRDYILPPFSKVISTFFSELIKGSLSLQILNSLLVLVQGFLLSFAIAIFILIILIWIPSLERVLTTLCTVFNSLPAVAIIPLIIMWFGIDTNAMRVIIIHGVLWALLTHMIEGLRTIPSVYREWGTNVELNLFQMFIQILFFAIMPEILAGVRVAWGRAWRALISAEMVFGMIGNLGGLGYYIQTARAMASMPRVLSGVLAIVVIGIVVEVLLFKQLEKYTIRKWGMSVEYKGSY